MTCRRDELNLRSGRSSVSLWGTARTGCGKNRRPGFHPRNGGLALTVDPFTRKHDRIHMLDDPKQLYASTRTFPVSLDQVTVFEAEMGAETYRINEEDWQYSFVGLILMDFCTVMLFDFIKNGIMISAI